MVHRLESRRDENRPETNKKKGERKAQNSEQEDMIREEGRRRGKGEDALLERKMNSDVSDVKRSCSCKLMKQRVMYDISRRKQRKRDSCDRDRLEVEQKEPEILSI